MLPISASLSNADSSSMDTGAMASPVAPIFNKTYVFGNDNAVSPETSATASASQSEGKTGNGASSALDSLGEFKLPLIVGAVCVLAIVGAMVVSNLRK